MVTIQIGEDAATIDSLEWTAGTESMREFLQDRTDIMIDDITPDKGDPDYYVATTIAKEMGGKITDFANLENDPSVIY